MAILFCFCCCDFKKKITLTKATVRESVSLAHRSQSIMGENKVAGTVRYIHSQKQREFMVLVFFLLFTQYMKWYPLHSGWVFPSQLR